MPDVNTVCRAQMKLASIRMQGKVVTKLTKGESSILKMFLIRIIMIKTQPIHTDWENR